MSAGTTTRYSLLDLPPSTIPRLREEGSGVMKITVAIYDEASYREAVISGIKGCFILQRGPSITWIDVQCLHRAETLDALGECYGIHQLVLEDILTDQRPKAEDYDKYLFVVLKALYLSAKTREMTIDQVSIILGNNYVISFREKDEDVFRLVRERLKTAKGRIRKMGADFLAYALIDSIVDRYFIVLESIGERFEDVEDEVVTVPDRSTLIDIYTLKREMLFLRQSVWPMREAVSVLERMDSPLIADNTKIYLRDVYDHTIQVIDNIETYRDMSASLLDTYLSSLSNKLNEIIKVLTVMSTVFIPMTFLTGLFGMNVAYMVKALEYNWAFPMILIMMLAIALTMLTYFKKRGWF